MTELSSVTLTKSWYASRGSAARRAAGTFSRTGSQNPMAMPGRKPHRHSGRVGLEGSGRLDGQILRPPTEIGNRHDQQMSVIGLTKLPVQRPGPASALAGVASARPRNPYAACSAHWMMLTWCAYSIA